MIPPIELQKLPAPAQKILDPASPAPLRTMAARAVVPGLKPADVVTVVVLLAEGADGAIAEAARKTLAALPAPILNGALASDLEPAVVAVLVPLYGDRADVMERLLAMPRIAAETVEQIAGACGEAVAELVATNEQRLLANPKIIERLYLNKATRMSTADRIVELAVRNGIELSIPAYKEVAAALANELIAEPTEEPTPDDIVFKESLDLGAKLSAAAPDGDTHEVDDEGQEKLKEQVAPLWVRIGSMTMGQKIRMATLGSATERALLLRDSNRVVAEAAIRSPLVQEPEVVRVSASRVVSEDVLRVIATNREWLSNHQVKVNLVMNPRTPFVFASKLVNHLREHELKAIAKSKNVTGPIASLAKQQLSRKTK